MKPLTKPMIKALNHIQSHEVLCLWSDYSLLAPARVKGIQLSTMIALSDRGLIAPAKDAVPIHSYHNKKIAKAVLTQAGQLERAKGMAA